MIPIKDNNLFVRKFDFSDKIICSNSWYITFNFHFYFNHLPTKLTIYFILILLKKRA